MGKAGGNLRAILRDETRVEHDRLDALMGDLALGDEADYAVFLRIQYLAHAPLEAWLAEHLPAEYRPPAQSRLLEDDLAALGRLIAQPPARFAAPAQGALGAAWVVAGSSLGNRAILAQRRKKGLDGPHSFLSCSRLPHYFKHLLGIMDSADDPQCAVAGAKAVFAWFEATARQELGEVAQ